MPRNKEALIRYRVINRCLVEKGYVTKQELKEACERALDIFPIGMRTIDADIHAMRHDDRLGYNAPIKIDRINKAYYYEDPEYSIDNIPLNEEELNSLVFASKLLQQFQGIDIFKTFTGSVQKLLDTISIYSQNDEDDISNFIDFEKVDQTKGTEFIAAIIEALKNKVVLEIEYRTFTSTKSISHIIHPYLLKEYRNRWFLIGYHHKYTAVRTYGLDRIVGLQEKPEVEFVDNGFNAREYYKNVIGISVSDQEPVEIHLAFTPVQAQYVITQPLHHSQELVSENADRIIFKYFLVPNFELISQVLGWGEEVEVLKPDEIKNSFRKLIAKLSMKY